MFTGITVLWDQGTTVYVTVNPIYQGQLCGLCGDFNGDGNNDMMTRQGEIASAIAFGHSWRAIPDCPMPEPVVPPCERTPHRKEWATSVCQILKGKAFKTCHDLVSR